MEERQENLEKQEEQEKQKQLKNKKVLIWTILNIFLILFGASVIVNITYIPKYLSLKNRNDNALKINIIAYDNSQKTSNKLFLFQYQSTMATLGDLMAQYSENYHLSNNGGYGRYINAISYYDEQNIQHTIKEDKTKNYYWSIYYQGQITPVGIDSLYLHMNDEIQLRYEKPTIEVK